MDKPVSSKWESDSCSSGSVSSSQSDTDAQPPNRKSSQEISSAGQFVVKPRNLIDGYCSSVSREGDDENKSSESTRPSEGGTEDSETASGAVQQVTTTDKEVFATDVDWTKECKYLNMDKENFFKLVIKKECTEILSEVTFECIDEISQEVLLATSENDTEKTKSFISLNNDITNDSDASSQEEKYRFMQEKIDKEIQSLMEEVEIRKEEKRRCEQRAQKKFEMEERYHARRRSDRDQSSQRMERPRLMSLKEELSSHHKEKSQYQWFQANKIKRNSEWQRPDEKYDVANEDCEQTSWYSKTH